MINLLYYHRTPYRKCTSIRIQQQHLLMVVSALTRKWLVFLVTGIAPALSTVPSLRCVFANTQQQYQTPVVIIVYQFMTLLFITKTKVFFRGNFNQNKVQNIKFLDNIYGASITPNFNMRRVDGWMPLCLTVEAQQKCSFA